MKKFPLMRNNILRSDLDLVIQHLKQDDPILTNGPNVRAFEQEWSEWLGVKYSVFVNSGSSANLISMALLRQKFPQGGEVIVPPLTWVSDVASVLQVGFKPVFVDINPRTLAMDTDKIIAAITEDTVAVFLTHVQGFNGLTDTLISELQLRNIALVEDVCESHGATHKGQKVGSIGQISNFSFYYAHHMSTIEGGMVCTNDAEAYQSLRMLRSHGMLRESTDADLKQNVMHDHPDLNPDFIFKFPAYNMRNTEIGGILGRAQLLRLDEIVRRRTENQRYFFDQIDGSRFQTDFQFEGSSNYAFNLILRNADQNLMKSLCNKLDESGIEYRRGSAGGGNQLRQPYLRNVLPKDTYTSCPITDHIHFFGMYIGNFPDLTFSEIDMICNVINSA